jgi:hypothetical protein
VCLAHRTLPGTVTTASAHATQASGAWDLRFQCSTLKPISASARLDIYFPTESVLPPPLEHYDDG